MNDLDTIQHHPSFCAAPWFSFYVNSFDSFRPCCVYQENLGPVKGRSPNELMDSKELEELRRKMLLNETPEPCKKACIQPEINGFQSQRQRLNKRFSNLKNGVTFESMESRKAVFQFYDVRMSNLCNFKCHFCGFENSSSWYDDLNQMDPNLDIYFDPVKNEYTSTKKRFENQASILANFLMKI